MAFYDYECSNHGCDEHFTVKQSMKDHELFMAIRINCLECGNQMEQVLYPVAIKFNGSGFYVNDYKAKTNNLTTSEK